MEINGREKMSKVNRFAMILSFVLIIVLGVLLAIDGQQNKKLSQELEEAAKQQYLEGKAFLATVESEYNSDMAVVSKYMPGIVCWGDSLTLGSGGEGTTYPKVLKTLIQDKICDLYDLRASFDSQYAYLVDPGHYEVNIPVVNMGVGGENTATIVGRNGGIPFVTSSSLTIPADQTPVEIHFRSKNGQNVTPLIHGKVGVNPVIIDGIQGTLSIPQESIDSKDYIYYFTRSAPGEAKTVSIGTEITTAASSQYRDYITVIFVGANGGYSNLEELISQQRAIINHQTANQDRFIIVGLHTGTRESRRKLEEAMQEEYGDRYINLREYMATKALKDAGMEPTGDDFVLMAQGATPYSLMVEDCLHFNATGYTLVGNLIFDTMNKLGYFEEVQQALTHNGN